MENMKNHCIRSVCGDDVTSCFILGTEESDRSFVRMIDVKVDDNSRQTLLFQLPSLFLYLPPLFLYLPPLFLYLPSLFLYLPSLFLYLPSLQRQLAVAADVGAEHIPKDIVNTIYCPQPVEHALQSENHVKQEIGPR